MIIPTLFLSVLVCGFLLQSQLFIGARDHAQRLFIAAQQVKRGERTEEEAARESGLTGRNVITTSEIEDEVRRLKEAEITKARGRTFRGGSNVQLRPSIVRLSQREQAIPQSDFTERLLGRAGFTTRKTNGRLEAVKSGRKIVIERNRITGDVPKSTKVTGTLTAFGSTRRFKGQINIRDAQKKLLRKGLKQMGFKAKVGIDSSGNVSAVVRDKKLVITKDQGLFVGPKSSNFRGQAKEFVKAKTRATQSGILVTLRKLITDTQKGFKETKSKALAKERKLLGKDSVSFKDIAKASKQGGVQAKQNFKLALLGIPSAALSIPELVVAAPVIFRAFKTAPIKTVRGGVRGTLESLIDNPAGTIVEFFAFSKGINSIIKVGGKTPIAQSIREFRFIQGVPKNIRPQVRAILRSSKAQAKINPFKVKKTAKITLAEVKSLSKVEARAVVKTAIQDKSTVLFGSAPARILSKKKTAIPGDIDIAVADIRAFSQRFIRNLPKSQRSNYVLKGQKLVRKSNGQALFDIKKLSKLIPEKGLITGKGRLPVSRLVKQFKVTKFSNTQLKLLKRNIRLNIKEIKAVKPKNKLQKKSLDRALSNNRKLLLLANKKGLKSKKVIEALEKELVLGTKFRPRFIKKLKVTLTVPTQKLVKIGGIKVVGFGEQTTRKALGVLQVLIEKNARRAKDVQAFLVSLEVQVGALKRLKPKTIIGRTRTKRKIKIIEDAIRMLKSKSFAKLIASQNPALKKSFPAVAKIKSSSLRKVNLELVRKRSRERLAKKIKLKPRATAKARKQLRARAKKRAKGLKVKVKRRPSVLPSRLPRSRLPSKFVASRIGKSKIPKRRVSKVPKSRLSRVRVAPSRVPPLVKPSRIPTSLIKSALFAVKASKIPASRLKKLSPSKLKAFKSKLVTSKLIRNRILENTKKRIKFEVEKEIKKKKRKGLKLDRSFKFSPDIAARLNGIRATPSERRKLLKIGRVFTGLEKRRLVRKRR